MGEIERSGPWQSIEMAFVLGDESRLGSMRDRWAAEASQEDMRDRWAAEASQEDASMERRGFFAGGALRRVFRHRASWRSMSARISGGSSESVCGSTSAPSMPVDEAPGEGGATGAGSGGGGRGAGALRFVRNELMSAWPAASIVFSVTPSERIESVAPFG